MYTLPRNEGPVRCGAIYECTSKEDRGDIGETWIGKKAMSGRYILGRLALAIGTLRGAMRMRVFLLC